MTSKFADFDPLKLFTSGRPTDTSYVSTIVCSIAVSIVIFASAAAAQPVITARPRPAPNQAGWFNSPVRVIFACDDSDGCPESTVLQTEGANQRVSGTARDRSGLEASASLVLNLDLTAPAVTIRSPVDGLATPASSVRVVAVTADGLSGIGSAACNGRSAQPDASGSLSCVVPLLPGVNDIVVEATDLASNSGSAGIRVTRTGVSSALLLEPEAFSVLVGQSKPIQVLDDFHADVAHVLWTVSNPALGEMSADDNVFTAKAPGVVTVTAIDGWHSATSTVTIYMGDRLPPGSIRWRNSSLSVKQMPYSGVPSDVPVAGHHELVSTVPAKRGLVTSINDDTGTIDWLQTPAMDESERVLTQRPHTIGGALLTVESRAGTGSALIRTAPAGRGAPWRYQSVGRLGDWIVQDRSGNLALIETPPDRFPKLVAFDGRTGVVRSRASLSRGVATALNIQCVSGENSVREIPAEIGPTTVLPDGTLVFEMLRVDDLQDYGECDQVSGRLRRVLELITIGSEGVRYRLLRSYETPAGSSPPAVTMFPVVSDRQGGLLAPWRASPGANAVLDSRIMHRTANGEQEYTLPVVGPIFVGRENVAVLTDGATLISFDVMNGDVKHQEYYPEKGVRIVSLDDNGTLLYSRGEKPGRFDIYGHPVAR